MIFAKLENSTEQEGDDTDTGEMIEVTDETMIVN